MTSPERRAHLGGYQWEDVAVLAYKAEGSAPFQDVTRQVLFAHSELACELRYFQVDPGGHSTLERHEHHHAVMVLSGRGRALVGERVVDLAAHDLVHVPAMTWHQFRACLDEPLGFLCMVNAERDRPQLPTPEDLAELSRAPGVARFIRL